MAKTITLTGEKLDELFVNEVAKVVKVVCRLPTKDKVTPLCTKWLKIFQRSTDRFSRNFMLLLLHTQLNHKGALSYPFTDPQSLRINLRTLHRLVLGMDNESTSQAEVDEDVEESYLSDESPQQEEFLLSPCSSNINIINQLLMDKNKALAEELQALQHQSEKLQAKLDELEKSAEAEAAEIDMLDKERCYMKRIFVCSSIKALKHLCIGCDPAEFFDILYTVLCDNETDFKRVRLLGEHFNRLMEARIDNYQREQRHSLLKVASQKYDKLRAKASRKYQHAVGMKLQAEEWEIVLSAMRNILVLRKLFIATFRGKASTRQAVLKFLQRCYEQMPRTLPPKMVGGGDLPGN